jgi:aminoglycoside 3'-phosphotransferase II
MSKTPGDPLSLLPPDWRDELRAAEIRPVALGMGGATVLQIRQPGLRDLFVKISSGADLTEFRNEVERTRWLAGRGLRVPALLRVWDDGEIGAAMMTAVPGLHAGDLVWPIAETIAALARGLFRLHSLSALDCPFDETVATRLARARESVDRGLINSENFAERNRGTRPGELLDRLVRGVPMREHEDIVLVHGDARFDNILIDTDGNVGFIDCGHAGRGDRYLDLEAVTANIEVHFGSEWVEPFALSYDKLELDPVKLRFFSDLYELF